MKVTAVFVSSVDGKITHGNDPDIYKWTSKEDSDHFFSLLNQYNLIIMGSKTYEAARSKIKLSPSKLRIVVTKNPRKYKKEEQKDIIEFIDESISHVIPNLEKRGYKKALFVGGCNLFGELLQLNLVNELYLTIEPYLFGKGLPLIEKEIVPKVSLVLEEVDKLNDKGTLLLKYIIKKNIKRL